MPFFSIVIPTYNRADLLPRCLDSVLRQKFEDYEVIVIDNYSVDNTVEVIDYYKQKCPYLLFKQEHNQGIIAHSRNVGIKMAKGKYICFLDSDDWFSDEKLALTYQVCVNHCPDLIYGKYQIVSERGKGRVVEKKLTSCNKYVELLTEGSIICNTTVTVKKDTLFSVGLLSESAELRAVEDFDCWLNIARSGASFYYIDDILCYYWVGKNESYSEKQVQQLTNVYNKHVRNLSNHDKELAQNCCDYTIGIIYQKIGNWRAAREIYMQTIRHQTIERKIVTAIRLILTLFRISG